MFRNRNRSAGFTLPEVLVTVAIVAVLAAAVVPTVVNQMSKGEAGGVIADVGSLSGGVTQFVTDTRRYPRTLTQLNIKPTASSALFLDLKGAQYSSAAVNSWKGPYLSTTQLTAAADGYVFSGLNLKADTLLIAPVTGNGFHITLNIVKAGGGSFTLAEIAAVDQVIDGGDGTVVTDCATPTANSAAGRLTWTESGVCAITLVRYKLVPTGS